MATNTKEATKAAQYRSAAVIAAVAQMNSKSTSKEIQLVRGIRLPRARYRQKGTHKIKGCTQVQNDSRKGVLDIGYLSIRISTRMRTRVSFGANVRARMARSGPFGPTCVASASHDWQVRTSPICPIAEA